MERIERAGSKKLLAIDGGGIRGVLALEVLQRIEDLVKAKSGRPDFRLADYFDYIAGTSTGGVVAAGLSIGMSVGEILAFYQEAGAQMFVKANLVRRLRYKFMDEPQSAKSDTVRGRAVPRSVPRIQSREMRSHLTREMAVLP